MAENKLNWSVAGIGFSMEMSDGSRSLTADTSHGFFLSESEPVIRLKVHSCAWPETGPRRKLFDSTSWWTLFEDESRKHFSFYDTQPPYAENRRAVLSSDYRTGDVYVTSAACRDFPVSYPLEELLYINVLPSMKGVILHSCGMVLEEGGVMFIGVSGAGKSTLTKIFTREAPCKILSDDRVIVREQEGRFWMYGTPWHGEVDVCENLGVPLKAICFIRHFPENAVSRMPVTRAAMTLLARCFPPFWDQAGMEATTALCADLAAQVPCYDLGFVPDQSVIPCVRAIMTG